MLDNARKGMRLAKEGANHLNFVKMLPTLEYEIPDGLTDDQIEDELFAAMLVVLAEHKKTCGGCTVITEDIRAKAEEIARKYHLKRG